jgi:hypothetical protein
MEDINGAQLMAAVAGLYSSDGLVRIGGLAGAMHHPSQAPCRPTLEVPAA